MIHLKLHGAAGDVYRKNAYLAYLQLRTLTLEAHNDKRNDIYFY